MKPPETSRVGPVIDSLVALFGDITGVFLSDGPVDPDVTTRRDILAIGSGNPAVSVALTKSPGLALNYIETLDIACVVSAWSGSSSFQALRDRCTDILGQVRDLLPQLQTDGTADLPLLGERMSWQQSSGTDGRMAWVTFTIRTKTSI